MSASIAQKAFGIWTGAIKGVRLRGEETLQIRCADFLRLAAPPDLLFHHSPGEGKRSAVSWTIQKAMGFQTGFPDLVILFRGQFFAIEFKMPGKRPTAEQFEIMRRIVEAGGRAAMIQTFGEFIAQAKAWSLCS